MAWTSSATPGELVCLDDRDAGAELTQALEETLDSRQSQSWSKVVAALLLALLAAAMPAGPEMAAVVILSSGLMAMLSLRNPINAPPAHAVFGFHGAVAPNQPPPTSAEAAPGQPMQYAEDATSETVGQVPVATVGGTVALAVPARPGEDVLRDLMGHISHELRTPLNAIIGFSDLMNQELYGPVGHPRYQEYLAHIRDSGRNLLKSAEDTLALTELLAYRGVGGCATCIDLADLLAECTARLSLDRHGLLPRFNASGTRGIEIEGDRRALRQILINVLAEAAERAGSEGTVVVAARSQGTQAILDIEVQGSAIHCCEPDHPSLRLTLARQLLELQGFALHVGPHKGGTGLAIRCVLNHAMQPDLFATAH